MIKWNCWFCFCFCFLIVACDTATFPFFSSADWFSLCKRKSNLLYIKYYFLALSFKPFMSVLYFPFQLLNCFHPFLLSLAEEEEVTGMRKSGWSNQQESHFHSFMKRHPGETCCTQTFLQWQVLYIWGDLWYTVTAVEYFGEWVVVFSFLGQNVFSVFQGCYPTLVLGSTWTGIW